MKKLSKKKADQMRLVASSEIANLAISLRAKIDKLTEGERKQMYKDFLESSTRQYREWPSDLQFSIITKACLTHVNDNFKVDDKAQDRKWKNERLWGDRDLVV